MMYATTTCESRREQRVRIDTYVEYSLQGCDERYPGLVTDISLGGIRVETELVLPFHSPAVVYLLFPGSVRPLALSGVVRWVRDGAMGIQFGLLSARETHLITQLARASHDLLDEADVAWVG